MHSNWLRRAWLHCAWFLLQAAPLYFLSLSPTTWHGHGGCTSPKQAQTPCGNILLDLRQWMLLKLTRRQKGEGGRNDEIHHCILTFCHQTRSADGHPRFVCPGMKHSCRRISSVSPLQGAVRSYIGINVANTTSDARQHLCH